MKKTFLLLILTIILVPASHPQNVGINTLTPQSKLHVFRGSSGYVGPYPHQDIIVESDNHAYINMLVPTDKEMGLLFGNPVNIASGGIVYNQQNLFFRTAGNVNRMIINSAGRVGIGTTTPNAPLSFPAITGSKITLYPGVQGNVGFGVQPNLFQIFSDYSGADIAFGFGTSDDFIERMRVKGTGNVGIGTTNPATRLDVVGDIHASSSIRADGNASADIFIYNTPRTSYYSIPASGFTAAYSSDGMGKEGSAGSIPYAFLTSGALMVAPLYLPHGATITQVKVFYWDESASQNISVQLVRRFQGGSYLEYEVMGSFISSGIPGQNANGIINSFNNAQIDNGNYNYHVAVLSTPGAWPSGDLRIKGVFITYTTTTAQ